MPQCWNLLLKSDQEVVQKPEHSYASLLVVIIRKGGFLEGVVAEGAVHLRQSSAYDCQSKWSTFSR